MDYKIILKALCQSVKICLSTLISETQSDFIKEILDNILIAQEIFYGRKKIVYKKFVAIKTDMYNIYD